MNIRILTTIALLLLILYPAMAQEKVHLVHGMGGGQADLLAIDEYFESHWNFSELFMKRHGYDTHKGVANSSTLLMDELSDKGSRNHILIAHSMGGPNARWTHKLNPNYFGGIISLCSPHGGATIANNLKSGDFEDFLTEVGIKGTSGLQHTTEFRAYAFIDWALEVYGYFFGTKSLPDFKTTLSSTLDLVLKKVKAIVLSDETEASLTTNSPDMNTLRSYNMNIPMIALWGNENYPTTLRMIGSQLTNDYMVGLGETTDEQIVDAFDGLHDWFNDEYNVKLAWSTKWYLPWFTKNAYARSAADLKVAVDFWGGEFQDGLNLMTGAKRKVLQYYTKQELLCGATQLKKVPNIDDGDDWIPPNSDCIYVTRTYSRYVWVTTASDGLIPKDSQIAMPGINSNCIVPLDGVNHQEAKKSWKTVIALDGIFRGSHSDPRNKYFFKLD